MEIESKYPNNILQSTRLLKPQEVANLLNISRSFTYRLLQSGVIPVVRLGRSCRVRPIDLDIYIEKNLHNQIGGD